MRKYIMLFLMLASAMSVPTTIVQVKKRGQFCSKLVQHEKVTTYSTKKEHCKLSSNEESADVPH